LQRSPWIPVQTLFSLQADDPRVAPGSEFARSFFAESWFITRSYLTEQKYRAGFTHYLQLIGQGNPESEAFSASFKMSYEELDRALQNGKYGPMHVYRLKVAAPDSAGAVTQVPAAEFNSQLATLRATFRPHSAAQ
jgi:hypothetical protein